MVSRALLIGQAAERLVAETAWDWSGWDVPTETLSDRLVLLQSAGGPRLGPDALAAVSSQLGGLTAREELELEQAWLYYLARG